MPSLLKSVRETVFVRAFALLRIPLIAHLRPYIVEMSEEKSVVKFPLLHRSKNHLGAMYFGALCVGADVSGGLMAMKLIRELDPSIQFVFKDFKARFLKRAHADVLFTSYDGAKVRALVERAAVSAQREEDTVTVIATAPEATGDEPVAEFELTISLKKK